MDQLWVMRKRKETGVFEVFDWCRGRLGLPSIGMGSWYLSSTFLSSFHYFPPRKSLCRLFSPIVASAILIPEFKL